jgi:hypothetical protein
MLVPITTLLLGQSQRKESWILTGTFSELALGTTIALAVVEAVRGRQDGEAEEVVQLANYIVQKKTT